MLTVVESRRALQVVAGAAVQDATRLVAALSGSPDAQRAAVFELLPGVIDYYSDGSAALAADFYDDERERDGARGYYRSQPVLKDYTAKDRAAIAWATQPWYEGLDAGAVLIRLGPIVQKAVARPHRDTVTESSRRDPQSVGWRRHTLGTGCSFCRMLASRGAVYRKDTARFASHTDCHCTAAPVFKSGDVGPEADALQYTASQERKTAADRRRVREYLAEHFPDQGTN